MYTDIHNHILPALDDGSRTLEESEVMIDRYISAGFTTVVATPHMAIREAQSARDERANAMEYLLQPAATAGLDLRFAGEIRLTPEIGPSDVDLFDYTFGGSRYLLVDFPSGSWPFYAEEALFRVQMLGLTPILAHPERYGWTSEDLPKAVGLVDRGVVLQLTLGSFVGAFGNGARKLAISMLETGMAHIVATDAHGAAGRMDSAFAGMDWLRTTYGEAALTSLLQLNPAAVLANEAIEPVAVNRHWRARLPVLPRFLRRRS